ncbi:MAG: hypothetical protein FWD17_12110 [Polyangiaceae bacterium]|nr:hypothetical protein [Polyangiaceae bacterium]
MASSTLAAALGLLAPAVARAQARATPETGAPAEGDDSGRARARYDAGTLAFGEGRFVEASLEFEGAAAAKSSAVALYTAALSWERANAPERAADDYGRALATGGLPADSTTIAERRLRDLEAVLGKLVAEGSADWHVQLDGNTEVAAPATLHAPPGVHTLAVRSAAHAVTRIPVVLQAGSTTRIDVPLPAPASAPAAAFAPVPPRHGMDGLAAAGWMTVGVATAVLLSGVLLRVEAVDLRDEYNHSPGSALYDRANNVQRWTNVAWIAGGTLLPIGLAMLLWPRPALSSPPVATTTPAASWPQGRF